ncbi:hypothetical protein F2Q68_00022021 [Brassica cretica]|uniref:Uncharacterized protein n=1 Tax=Brassica cretica TaxID=69181 RepID=A0A8S9G155_BRACR|nr:hypothetical protein F2Q68_00022021 [Brassica cretica]
MMDEVGYGERVWIGQAEDWVTDQIRRIEMASVRCLDTIGPLCREQDLSLCTAERKTMPHSGGHTKFSQGERLNINKGQRSNKGKWRGFGGQANNRGNTGGHFASSCPNKPIPATPLAIRAPPSRPAIEPAPKKQNLGGVENPDNAGPSSGPSTANPAQKPLAGELNRHAGQLAGELNHHAGQLAGELNRCVVALARRAQPSRRSSRRRAEPSRGCVRRRVRPSRKSARPASST